MWRQRKTEEPPAALGSSVVAPAPWRLPMQADPNPGGVPLDYSMSQRLALQQAGDTFLQSAESVERGWSAEVSPGVPRQETSEQEEQRQYEAALQASLEEADVRARASETVREREEREFQAALQASLDQGVRVGDEPTAEEQRQIQEAMQASLEQGKKDMAARAIRMAEGRRLLNQEQLGETYERANLQGVADVDSGGTEKEKRKKASQSAAMATQAKAQNAAAAALAAEKAKEEKRVKAEEKKASAAAAAAQSAKQAARLAAIKKMEQSRR